MLSGIKFVPRDHLVHITPNSGSDEDGEEKKKSNRREGEKDKRKKGRSKKYYSSEEESSSSLESDSEELSGQDERRSKRRRRRRMKRKGGSLSEDSHSSDGNEKPRHRKSKHKDRSEKKKQSMRNDGSDIEEKDTNVKSHSELARKEVGLEWMLKFNNRIESNHTPKDDEKQQESNQAQVEEMRTNPKELNPYLRDNGSGYPDESTLSETGNQLLSSSIVGDGGASWRLKALKRAKEQAAREGRKLEEVVEERWDSLGELAASVATSSSAPAHAHLHAIRKRKGGQAENFEDAPKGVSKEGTDGHRGSRHYLHDASLKHPEMRKPKQDYISWKTNKGQKLSSEDKSLVSSVISGLNKFDNDGSFMDKVNSLRTKENGAFTGRRTSLETSEYKETELRSSEEKNSNQVSSVRKEALSANQLAAKILQLRMKGKHQEAEQLSKELELVVDKQDAGSNAIRHETDENLSRRHMAKQMTSAQKKGVEDSDLHLAKKIMQNRQYSLSGSADDEYDFVDAPSKKSQRKNKEIYDEKGAIPKQLLTQKERCLFCFENPSRPKHLVISIANFTYLMLPQWQPVVLGHCIILTLQHEAATRTVDQNVWEEIRNFKKCLLKMFAKEDKNVVFIETVIGLAKQRRHCLVECIPIPYHLSNEAPMYFKKAIDEAEEEWGQHEMKKLIPTSGNLRQVIPANFAYFHVEFGLDRGFVHVIDDDSNFSSGFGLNVIRGMLRLPEEDMHRRRRYDPVEKQKHAVATFVQQWEPYDWTRQLD